MIGKLIVVCGPMFAGKSTELQRVGRNHERSGHKVIYIKNSIDNRYSENEIVTHDGNKVTAINSDVNGDILLTDKVRSADVVLVDEIQFFNLEIKSKIEMLVNEDKLVVVSGLDMDYQGKPFTTTAMLMSMADEVIKLTSVCKICGNSAPLSARISKEDTEIISLGSEDKYFPICRKCKKHV